MLVIRPFRDDVKPSRLAGVSWSLVGVLAEPTRRAVYDEVRRAAEPVTRDEVAAALDLGRPLAAFHLDKLAEAGLLAVSYARPPGRGGRGAGRPAKRYAVVDDEVSVSVPARRYALAGQILAEAVATAPARGDARAHTLAIARTRGEQLGAESGPSAGRSRRRALEAMEERLAALGYEPTRENEHLVLRNCPFHALVDVAPELVCELNHAFLEGLLAGAGADDRLAGALEPAEQRCCVCIYPRAE